MSKSHIFETDDDTQLLVEIGVNSTGAAVITTHHASYFTPYEEPDLDAIRKEAYAEGYKEGMQLSIDDAKLKEEYQRGLNDAWDAARWLAKSNAGINFKIFGWHFTNELVQEISASEAIDKIQQYEQEKEEQIQVGDEVMFYNGEKCVVTVVGDGQVAEVMDKGGFSMMMDDGLRNSMKKTGRHFSEIAEVLKKMQEKTA